MSYHELVVTAVALVAINGPVLYLTWRSIRDDRHAPAALRRGRGDDRLPDRG